MSENKPSKTAQRLRLCREEAHETLDHIGRLVGVNKSTVLRWERGSTAKINLPTLQRLAQHFGVDVAWLAGEDVPQNGGDWLARHALSMDELIRLSVLPPQQPDLVRQNTPALDAAWDEPSAWDGVHFWLRVVGDSMQPLMNEGDLVLVRRQSSVESGQFAILLLDGSESMIRRIQCGSDYIELQSINPYYPPRRFSGDDALRVTILGLVVESKRKFV